MTKSDLIQDVAKASDVTLDRAAVVVNAVFEQMTDAMKRGDRVEQGQEALAGNGEHDVDARGDEAVGKELGDRAAGRGGGRDEVGHEGVHLAGWMSRPAGQR